MTRYIVYLLCALAKRLLIATVSWTIKRIPDKIQTTLFFTLEAYITSDSEIKLKQNEMIVPNYTGSISEKSSHFANRQHLKPLLTL